MTGDTWRPMAEPTLTWKQYEMGTSALIDILLTYGTDQCIYVLKEIIDLYRRLNGSVFVYVSWMLVRHLTGSITELCLSNWVQGAFQDTYCEY